MNGIFAVEKPSGVSSSNVVLQLQSIFNGSGVFAKDLAEEKQKVHEQLTAGTKWSASKIANRVQRKKIKVGHGGTLDPLASGVLIIGIGTGTKQLSYYLGECTKTYETRAVLGQSTTTGDSEGEVVTQTEVGDVTLERLKKAAAKFVGKIKQTPPVYSALKVDGKPLYEYARKGIPVPKALKPRDVKVLSFVVHDDFGPHEKYGALSCCDAGESMGKAIFNNPTLNDHDLFYSEEFMNNPDVSDDEKITKIHPKLLDPSVPIAANPPVFHATATVGSGTYIRSLVSDLGRAVGSSAFMAELIRSKQADWELGKNVFSLKDFTDRDEKVWGPVLKTVFDTGSSVDLAEEFKNAEERVGREKKGEEKEEEKKEEEKKEEEKKEEKEERGRRRETQKG
ncbi:hypothetical protein JCM33374_g2991 [Metschnikowia sp. JCM 33374]|nr:hypothetical protein JCM33374_g2991 [Metschnikowia sp. JCM 33374]